MLSDDQEEAGNKLNIVLLTAQYPPTPDGIGDYTLRLAESLVSAGQPTIVVTGTTGHSSTELPGVEVAPILQLAQRDGIYCLLKWLENSSELPDAMVLQFNQFSWGKRGLNPHLPRVMREVRRRWPQIRIAVMFHEKVVPPTSWKFRIMRMWQVRQYNQLADLADVRLFSIQRWAEEERVRRPDRPAKDTVHLPVGSNLPFCPPDKTKTRAQVGITDDALICGVFGSAHPSRLLDWVAESVRELRRRGRNAVVLYVGGDGDAVREACAGVPVFDQGRLPPAEAAACFPVMDLYLSPFIDGMSTRRGSAMAALQHAVPVLSTDGPNTDSIFRDNPLAISLTDVARPQDFVRRVLDACAEASWRDLGVAGRDLYLKNFDWPNIAQRLTNRLIGSSEDSATTLVLPDKTVSNCTTQRSSS